MWDPSGPGIEPISPALAGGFFTPEPAGTTHVKCFSAIVLSFFSWATDVYSLEIYPDSFGSVVITI